MKRALLLAAALACAACAHPQHVEAQQEEQGPDGPSPETLPARPEVRASAAAGRPELSLAPSGLMVDDGPKMIQAALAKKGYLAASGATGVLDEETSGALRRFQTDQHLARTGAPDRETIRRLGLAVGKVFRKAPGAN